MAWIGMLAGGVTSLSIVTQLFILTILGCTVFFNIRYTRKVVELGPTILTTIGIFGTFLGVAIGLSHFDTANVQASVPLLLAGLKTAFWASVFGVGAAVQLKAREFFAPETDADGEAEQSASPVALLADIRDALCSTRDASLVQQLRLVRQDLNDRLIPQVRASRQEANERLESLRAGQREVVGSMATLTGVQSQALQDLAQAGAGSLVTALQQVVLDFNDRVASQFGENYRDLNHAVQQLLAWQSAYRETISSTNDQLAATLRQLGYAASDFRTVTEGSERFARTAERVAVVMEGIERGEERLAVLARSLGKLTEEAAGRVPFIESRLYELTTQMTSAVQANQMALNGALSDSAAELQRTMVAAKAELSAATQTGAAQLQANQEAIAAALAQNAAAMTDAMQAMQADLMAAVGGLMRQLTDQVEAAALPERVLRRRRALHVIGEAADGD
jgi:hypothetical protein